VKKAFTLVEMMVVIGIVALVGAFGLTTYKSTQNAKNVEKSAKAIADQLIVAHADAMGPDASLSNIQTVDITVDTAVGTIVKKIVSTSTTVFTAPSGIKLSTSNMTNNTYSYIANDAYTLGQIKPAATSADAIITVSNNDNSISYNVTVNHMTGVVDVSRN